jgi:hypothetical protein
MQDSVIGSIVSSKEQTKRWRKEQDWYINGKQNECEIYQRKIFEHIIDQKIAKTQIRIDYRDYSLVHQPNPMNLADGFEFTENFDGQFFRNQTQFLVNFKMTCDRGGAQTRTLREVYHFIKAQNSHLSSHDNYDLYFINILDGDTFYLHRDAFQKLSQKHIFVGDTFDFIQWWKTQIN